VNWFAHYPGDYARDTSHLTLVQHGAYRVLLDHYYSTGAAIPSEPPCLWRICRAYSSEERDAVDFVAGKFFTVGSDGLLHNQRADREIARRAKHHKVLSDAGKLGVEARETSRPRNPHMDALGELHGKLDEITRPTWRAIGVALSIIRGVCPAVTPEEIRRRAGFYPSHFPGCSLTSTALAKHWARCDRAAVARPHAGESNNFQNPDNAGRGMF
jgi:uncharacterized protein YdaU (DUF1376 family)